MSGRRGLAAAVRRARCRRRLQVFLLVYLAVAGAVIWRLVDVQVLAADDYRELAQRQAQREIALPASRGAITDRRGETLALSVPATAVYADPRAIADSGLDPTFSALELAPLLERDLDDVMDDLTADTRFVYLGRQLPRSVGEEVAERDLPGVGVLSEPRRSYPAGSLAAQVVGFAGIDGEGLSGVEAAHDDLLTGAEGTLRIERAPGGLDITAAPREVRPATPGRDLVLTLDRAIQHTAERVLAEAVEAQDARGGSAVVMDVADGDVLAMASHPTYDPAAIGEADAYARRNRAVTDVFEPGSVSKALTLAAAVEEGVAAADDVRHVPESVEVDGHVFTDVADRRAGDMTVSEIIAESSNVGTIGLAEELGDEALRSHLTGFGFGEPTGLGFPGEATGVVPPPEEWWATTRPTVAIGQGISASLLHVAGAFQTLAAGGERVEPRLVRGTVDGDGRFEPADAADRHRVVSEETAAEVAEVLAAAVTDGTGVAAQIPGRRVAGKTGTAQKPSETSRGYEEDAYIATFAGFAPLDEPELVVAVMIDEPQEDVYGGVVAAPVFAQLMDFALGHRRVEPDTPGDRAEPGEPADDVDAAEVEEGGGSEAVP